MRNWTKTLLKILRFTRSERVLALAIFVVFQAVLPSYASAISDWTDNDQIVICAAHGIIELASDESPVQATDEGAICIVAQSASFALAQVPVAENALLPRMGNSPLVPRQLQFYRFGQKQVPHAQRAPPTFS